MAFLYILFLSCIIMVICIVFFAVINIEQNNPNNYKSSEEPKKIKTNQRKRNIVYYSEKEGFLEVYPCSINEEANKSSYMSLSKGVMLALTLRDQSESYPVSIFIKQEKKDGTVIYKVFEQPSSKHKVPGVETDFSEDEKIVIETSNIETLESLKSCFSSGEKDRLVKMD